jgi:hypothetical protein
VLQLLASMYRVLLSLAIEGCTSTDAHPSGVLEYRTLIRVGQERYSHVRSIHALEDYLGNGVSENQHSLTEY